MQFKSVRGLSRQDIKQLITTNFLDFCVNYDLGANQYSFVLDNGIHVDLLANGVIAFNLDIHNTHTNGDASKSILLSCAVHGNETAPIEICNFLIAKLLNEVLETSHRVLFIFGNIPSIKIGERFVEENLNRLFSKEFKTKTQEGIRAQELMPFVDSFFSAAKAERIHYDLHTAIRPSKNEKFAVYPFLHGRKYNKQQLAFLAACDVNTILLSQTPTGTFSYYSSFNHEADGFTVELGKVKPFGENNMLDFKNVKQKLVELLSEQEVSLPTFAESQLEIFTVNQVINKQKDDFRLHFADDVANFTGFSKGQILATESGTDYRAQFDGEAIVFPNANVAIGQRAILTVIPYAL